MRHLCWPLMVVAVLVFSAAARQAPAVPITYTVSGIGSGTIGGTGFTNQAFAVTIQAETTSVQVSGTQNAVNNLSTQVQIGATTATGQAGASYTFPLFDVFAYAGGPVGEEIDQFPFYVNSPALVGYDLKTAIGPLNVTFPVQGGYVFTNLGQIHFSSASPLSFQATVPEPSTLVVAIPSALALASLRRRRGKV